MANGDEKYRVRSVERAFSILEALKDGGDMRLIDVSRSTMLAKGMVFKLLDTLCSAGYVERDPEQSVSSSLKPRCGSEAVLTMSCDHWLARSMRLRTSRYCRAPMFCTLTRSKAVPR